MILLLLCSLVASIQANDPVADPKFPEVNVQYGAFGSRYQYGAGFAYPACQDKIILDSSNDSVTSCGVLCALARCENAKRKLSSFFL